MPSSRKWKVLRIDEFDKSLKNLLKSYYRRNEKGKRKFQELLMELLGQLQKTEFPLSPYWKGKPEPSPSGSIFPGQTLAKLYMKLPGLDGAAREGRIIYLIDRNRREIKLLYIYTHKDFVKRPSDKLIRKLLGRSGRNDS